MRELWGGPQVVHGWSKVGGLRVVHTYNVGGPRWSTRDFRREMTCFS